MTLIFNPLQFHQGELYEIEQNMKLQQFLKIHGNCKSYKGIIELRSSGVKTIPKGFHCQYLDLEDSLVRRLPKGFNCFSLYLRNSKLKKLPKGLNCFLLDLEYSNITEIPKDLKCQHLYLENTKIKNYPIVHGCGEDNRTIYLDWNDRSMIHIGCFKGTKEEAIQRIKEKYKDPNQYIEQIEKCFALEKKYSGYILVGDYYEKRKRSNKIRRWWG